MTESNLSFMHVTPFRLKSLMLEESYSLYSVKTRCYIHIQSSEVYGQLHRFFLYYSEFH